MLRISVTSRPDGMTLALEGRLAGPWVDELRATWRGLVATRDARSVRVDLDAVTFIDTAGKALLWAMQPRRRRGVLLVGHEAWMPRACLARGWRGEQANDTLRTVSIQTIDCPPYSNDQIDQVLMDSFPASDPPPWTLGAIWRRKDAAEPNSRENEPRFASVLRARGGPAE